MEVQAENILDAMKIGAQSELGLMALIVVSMSIVGVVLFRNSSDPIKFGVFVFLIGGVTTFAYASMRVLQNAKEPVEISTAQRHEDVNAAEDSDDSSPELQPVESAKYDELETPPQPIESGYIYLGTFSNGTWKEPRFEKATGALKVGDIVQLATERKMFKCAPYRKSFLSFQYTFCNDVIGTAEKGQKVKVIKDPEIIGLNRAWVYVEELP